MAFTYLSSPVSCSPPQLRLIVGSFLSNIITFACVTVHTAIAAFAVHYQTTHLYCAHLLCDGIPLLIFCSIPESVSVCWWSGCLFISLQSWIVTTYIWLSFLVLIFSFSPSSSGCIRWCSCSWCAFVPRSLFSPIIVLSLYQFLPQDHLVMAFFTVRYYILLLLWILHCLDKTQIVLPSIKSWNQFYNHLHSKE